MNPAPVKIMKASIKFPSRAMAQEFASAWSRATLRGHSITASAPDGSAEVWLDGVTDESKAFIDSWVESLTLSFNQK